MDEHKAKIESSVKGRKTKNKKLWQSIKSYMFNEYQQKVFEDLSDDSMNAEYEPG